MKAVGIVAEYNPFHNGHAYQIRQAKKLSHADCVIVAMSGNYVQRGVPAMLDKFSRAYLALCGGADFVFELPTLWATASAEYFAAAGIALLDSLGCADTVSFGCETKNLTHMTFLAKILSNEPVAYRRFLSDFMKQGLSFPAAREKAALAFLRQTHKNINSASESSLSSILRSPNNILGLEYLKALIRQDSSLTPLPILRLGSGYHSFDLQQEYCSASAIRKRMQDASDENRAKDLSRHLPPETVQTLLADDVCFLTEQDFSDVLFYKLLCEREHGYSAYADVSKDLSNRIRRSLFSFTDYKSFCETLKSRDVTYARVSRNLLHILLNLKKTDYEKGKRCGYVPYLRLLGFRKEAAPFFSELKKHARIPLITKPSKHGDVLDLDAQRLFCQDMFASDLYYGVLANKSGVSQKNERQRSIVIV